MQVSHFDPKILRGSFILRDLPDLELEQIAAMMRRRRYSHGQALMQQGDPGQTLAVVLLGHVKVVLPTETGEEALLTILGPGDIVGELALLDGGPRSATVVALEAVEVATLQRADFLGLLHRSRPAMEGLLASLARNIRRLTDEVGDLMYLGQQDLLAKKLLELAEAHGRTTGQEIEIDLPLTQDELAMMIGATRPQVNKLLGQFDAQGVIGRRRRRIVIRDLDALRHRVMF
jgi:CRP/FNR family transcriptional regulator, cyclic AMP receptor protein